MFDRLELLIGQENLNKIINTTVLIIGLGGVGSYALESLTRSGIGSIIIVDKDTIDVSNLNRQLMTNQNNIGLNKTDVWEKRIKEINPNCNISKITKTITKENVYELFNKKIDYVIDANDTLEVKFEIIKICKQNNIKLISSMGTGNKMDPSKLEIIDIRKTSYDPLAKKLRKMIKDNGIKGRINVISSTEKPVKTNSKTIASNAFVPATAGLMCTSFIINDIVGDLCEK